MSWAIFAPIVLLAVSSPHLVSQVQLAPLVGIVLWLAALTLRALLALFLVALVVFFLPATQLFQLLTHWCFHGVVPFFTTHLGFSGHSLGDAATIVPALVVALSAIWATVGAWRAGRAVRRWIRRSALGPGPGESVVVGGSEVVLATAGVRSPRVIVSAGALTTLDDAELEAGLQHERGHIARRHRVLLLLGSSLFAVARLLPGSRRALGHLHLHIERDADEYSVRRTGDPLALAAAICKAALASDPAAMGAPGNLTGSSVATRVGLLIHGSQRRGAAAFIGAGLAVFVATVALSIAIVSPTIVGAGFEQLQGARGGHLCQA